MKKALLISDVRTGSSLITSVLGNHKDVNTPNFEPLNIYADESNNAAKNIISIAKKLNLNIPKSNNDDLIPFIEGTYELYNFFKIQRHQIDINNPTWDHLVENYSIIYLTRDNKIHQIVSFMQAMSDSVWYIEGARKHKQSPVKINISEFDFFLKREEIYSSEVRKKFVGSDIFCTTYEKVCQDMVGELKSIQEFLLLDIQELNTEFKKINTKPLKERIINYDEVFSHFRGTKYEEMFNEEG